VFSLFHAELPSVAQAVNGTPSQQPGWRPQLFLVQQCCMLLAANRLQQTRLKPVAWEGNSITLHWRFEPGRLNCGMPLLQLHRRITCGCWQCVWPGVSDCTLLALGMGLPAGSAWGGTYSTFHPLGLRLPSTWSQALASAHGCGYRRGLPAMCLFAVCCIRVGSQVVQ
jgi:hypothetical protein